MKILFTSSQHATFIKQDLSLLRKHFSVDHVVTRGLLAPLAILAHISRADVTFTWMASVYAGVVVFLARLTGKRSFVVIGGVDVASIPEMQYGIWLSPWRRPFVRYALRKATTVLAVDSSLAKKAVHLARYPGANIVCLPTGYDPEVWVPAGTKQPLVLTVAKCEDRSKMRVKGLDILFECARLIPDTRFVLIGISPHLVERVREQAPPGMEIVPLVDQPALLQHYQRSKVYCQPSYVEGLPNSLCEAMLCECVPVGTDVGGIPTAMGEVGFLVPYGNPRSLADAIGKALREPQSTGQRGRTRVSTQFSLQKREDALRRLVSEAGP